MFEEGKRYIANVNCCETKFCTCPSSKIVLTITKKTKNFVYLKSVSEMQTKALRMRCKLENGGASFIINLIDNGDPLKRKTKTSVYSKDITSDDEDDHTPLSVLWERQKQLNF